MEFPKCIYLKNQHENVKEFGTYIVKSVVSIADELDHIQSGEWVLTLADIVFPSDETIKKTRKKKEVSDEQND